MAGYSPSVRIVNDCVCRILRDRPAEQKEPEKLIQGVKYFGLFHGC